MRRRLALLGLAGLAAPAAAQVGRDGYRTDVPGVITPPPPPPLSPFQAAYRRAGSPRMVLFFNREIADVASSDAIVRQRDTTTLTEEERLRGESRTEQRREERTSAGLSAEDPDKFGTLPAQAVPPPPPAAPTPPAGESRNLDVQRQRQVQGERTTELSIVRPRTGARPAPIPEAQQWLFESGFNNRVGGEGARLVDRATAMRLAATIRLDDPQRLETAAIRNFAEVAIVVRGAPLDPNGGTELGNLVFRVTAIDTRNGQLLADDVMPPAPNANATAIGEAAGAQLVARLIQQWSGRR